MTKVIFANVAEIKSCADAWRARVAQSQARRAPIIKCGGYGLTVKSFKEMGGILLG
jgi:hypothetical protein